MSRIGCAWGLVTAPAEEPVALAAAKLQLSLDDGLTALDGATERRVTAARLDVEGYLHRGLFTQTWKYAQDRWTDEIVLPMAAPLQSVTHVKYYDGDGTLQTLSPSSYIVDTLSEPGRVLRNPTAVWPTLQSNRPLAVEITYVVGWDDIANIPTNIVEAILLQLQHLYEGGTELAESVKALLAKERAWWREPQEE